MLLRALEKRGRHTILMDRVDFIKIENSSGCCIEEPRPLPLRALPFNQLASAPIGSLDGAIITHQLAKSIAGKSEISLGSERAKPTARADSGIEKQPRRRMISLEQELEKLSRDRSPFGLITSGLGR